eukprot:354448-Chlamydomonas_euryale.AAC.12
MQGNTKRPGRSAGQHKGHRHKALRMERRPAQKAPTQSAQGGAQASTHVGTAAHGSAQPHDSQNMGVSAASCTVRNTVPQPNWLRPVYTFAYALMTMYHGLVRRSQVTAGASG